MTSFVVVGAGWRAEMFWRLGAARPGLRCLGAVVRTPRELPVPALRSLDDVRPDFVVTAVPWDAGPGVIRAAVDRGLPVLAETPPAPDLAGTRALWEGPRTVVRTPLVRRQTGYDLDLDGFETDIVTLGTEVLFRNTLLGRRYNDEEIAISTQLGRMAAWVGGDGPPPYPLADGLHDHHVALAIEEAADTGRTVTTSTEAWA